MLFPCTLAERFLVIAMVTSLAACSTKRITVETDVPSEVSLVKFDDLTGKGVIVGKTPVTIDTQRLESRVIKVNSQGKIPIYWFNANTFGESISANFKMVELPEPETLSIASAVKSNRATRLLFRAYTALSQKDAATALSLAKKASEIDPYLAMPHVVQGIALMQQNKKDEARVSFRTAKSLDPEDNEVDKLLRLVK